MSNETMTYRQHADAWMLLRASLITGAPFAGNTSAAGQKSAPITGDVTGVFMGPSAWSPPT